MGMSTPAETPKEEGSLKVAKTPKSSKKEMSTPAETPKADDSLKVAKTPKLSKRQKIKMGLKVAKPPKTSEKNKLKNSNSTPNVSKGKKRKWESIAGGDTNATSDLDNTLKEITEGQSPTK